MLRRLLQLYIGLVLYGVSTALFVHANLGADPWDVFHLGVAKQLGISFGTVIILTGAAVLLLWIPIRQMPGLGTVSNVIVLGLAADAGRPAAAGVDGGAQCAAGRSDCAERYRYRNVYWRGLWPRAARWPDDRSACSHWLVTARYPDGDRAFRTADWLAAGGQIWRRNRHLRAVDWAADPAVPTVVQPARQPQRGQPSPGNSFLN